MANVEFDITVVVKAKTGDFSSVEACLAAVGRVGDTIAHPYGGRVIKMDSVTSEVTSGNQAHIITDRVVLVMKASGVLPS